MLTEMSKQLMIHAATEIILVSVLSIYFYKKQSSLTSEIETLKATVQKQQDMLDRCVAQINHLTDILTYGRPRMHTMPTTQSPSHAQRTTISAPMSTQTETLSGAKSRIASNIGEVFTLIQPMVAPIMAMTSPNEASVIIGHLETLEKDLSKAPPADVPKVEIANDDTSMVKTPPSEMTMEQLSEKDLNDVIEALNDEGPSASSSIEHVGRSRSPSISSITSIVSSTAGI
jgi:hypothetical protein